MNAIGYVGLYAITRLQIVHEISELIEHHDTGAYSQLIFSKEDMNPARGHFVRINKHEFRYKGKMYDVVSQQKIGDTIHFTVIHDHRDEINFDQLAANTNLQEQSQANPKSADHVLLDTMVKSLFAPLYFPSTKPISFKPHIHALTALFCFELPANPFQRVPVPPPKIS